MLTHPTLYKPDSAGRVRFWFLESEATQYRTVSGLLDGTEVRSGWTTVTAKSQATDQDQCTFEIQAKYKHQLDREYHTSIDTIDEPNFFEPMLAKTYASYPGRCYAQPKLDGIRCIARAEGLFSRQGQPITAVPHIHAVLAPLFAENPDLILDGELYNHDFREDFGEISSIVRKKKPTAEQLERAAELMQYHVYDLPSHEGPFGERNEALFNLITDLDCPWIVRVETVHVGSLELLDDLYSEWCGLGFEGQMVRLDGHYEQKRSKQLLKRKEFLTREYRVKEWVEGNGNWAGAAKRATLINDDGSEFGAGVRGKYADLAARLSESVGPDAVATLRFFQLSPDGVPRFPVVIDYHPEGRID